MAKHFPRHLLAEMDAVRTIFDGLDVTLDHCPAYVMRASRDGYLVELEFDGRLTSLELSGCESDLSEGERQDFLIQLVAGEGDWHLNGTVGIPKSHRVFARWMAASGYSNVARAWASMQPVIGLCRALERATVDASEPHRRDLPRMVALFFAKLPTDAATQHATASV